MKGKKKNSPLDDVMNMMGYDNTEHGESVTDMDDPSIINSNVDDLTETEKPDEEETPGTEETDEDPHEDTSDIPEDVLNKINNISSSNNEEATEEDEQPTEETSEQVDPGEANQIEAFFDAFAEALNWDVNDQDKPNSIEGLIDYIGDLVEQNSKPQYAD
jgi:hypothetical protein